MTTYKTFITAAGLRFEVQAKGVNEDQFAQAIDRLEDTLKIEWSPAMLKAEVAFIAEKKRISSDMEAALDDALSFADAPPFALLLAMPA